MKRYSSVIRRTLVAILFLTAANFSHAQSTITNPLVTYATSSFPPTPLPPVIVNGTPLSNEVPVVPLNAIGSYNVLGHTGRMDLLTRPPGFVRSELAIQADSRTENFDSAATGGLPAGWVSAITGVGVPAWSVAEVADAPSGGKVLQQSAVTPKPSFPLCFADQTSLADGFVEVKFKTVSGTNDQAAGVVWRARDAANYYICRANALEDNVVLYKLENGKRTPLDIVGRKGGYGVEAKVTSAQWHTLRVDFSGPRFRVALDDKELFAVEDSTSTDAGKVGLWTKADSVTLFDDFSYGGR